MKIELLPSPSLTLYENMMFWKKRFLVHLDDLLRDTAIPDTHIFKIGLTDILEDIDLLALEIPLIICEVLLCILRVKKVRKKKRGYICL